MDDLGSKNGPIKPELTPEAWERIKKAGEVRLPEREAPTILEIDAFERRLRQAETMAPRLQSGPLPKVINTLRHIPEAKWPQYGQGMDGIYRLTYIEVSDTASVNAYVAEIASGTLETVEAGMTPAQYRGRIEAKYRESAAMIEELDKADDDANEANHQIAMEALQKRQQEERVRAKEEYERARGRGENISEQAARNAGRIASDGTVIGNPNAPPPPPGVHFWKLPE